MSATQRPKDSMTQTLPSRSLPSRRNRHIYQPILKNVRKCRDTDTGFYRIPREWCYGLGEGGNSNIFQMMYYHS